MKSIDYYLSTASPWTWLGHDRMLAIAARHGATVDVKPVDFGVIFPASGGLPLPRRAPQRQGLPAGRAGALEGAPGHAAGDRAEALPGRRQRRAPDLRGPAAVRAAMAGDVLSAVWVREENIADPAALAAIAARHGVDDVPAAIASGKAVYAAHTQEALQRGVFGAPSYVVSGEIFWGQDRLEFLDRALAA
ncbi:MAG: DsbA family protein [Betaproteobacteria bacterium]|nr:DsbA family protein [Betaproteobacteria bacterium]